MISNFNYNLIFKRFKIVFTRGTISRRTWYPRVDSKKINVVLIKDFENLGKSGDIIETSRGYANYHLIPKGIAAYANWYNIDLYSKHTSYDSTLTHKDHKLKGDEDLSYLRSKPQLMLFSGRFANYQIIFNVSTYASDKTKLTSPISLYEVLDKFSNKYNIDLVPSQIAEIRVYGSNKTIDVVNDFEYMNFCNIGKYEILVNFPLKDNRENKLEFILDILPLQYGSRQGESETFEFYLPQT